MNFTYTEAGNVFNVTASLSADGKSMIGTCTEQVAQTGQTNGTCSGGSLDSGNISGTAVSKLSGTYLGQLCKPLDSPCTNGTADSATATLSENSSGNLTVSMILTGVYNTSFTLTGPVTGNFFLVQGTFGGQSVSYDGYYELTADSGGTLDIPTLYLVNVACPTPQTCANLLMTPQTQ